MGLAVSGFAQASKKKRIEEEQAATEEALKKAGKVPRAALAPFPSPLQLLLCAQPARRHRPARRVVERASARTRHPALPPPSGPEAPAVAPASAPAGVPARR